MRGTEFVDDRSPARRLVAERAPTDAPFEFIHQLARKAVRENRKGAIEDQPCQLPMPGHRVLSWRRFSHPAKRADGRRFAFEAIDSRDIREAEPAKVRHGERDAS